MNEVCSGNKLFVLKSKKCVFILNTRKYILNMWENIPVAGEKKTCQKEVKKMLEGKITVSLLGGKKVEC